MARRGRPHKFGRNLHDDICRAKDMCDFERYYRALTGWPKERQEFFEDWPGSRSAKFAILRYIRDMRRRTNPLCAGYDPDTWEAEPDLRGVWTLIPVPIKLDFS